MINKFIFLVPALSQPRCIKRVSSINNMGYLCDVYGYQRGKYDVNDYPSNIKVVVLDHVKDGDYLKKAINGWRILSRVVSINKRENVAFYAFGFFQAFVCAVKGVTFIYEISDIFYAYPRLCKLKWLLKTVDKFLIKKSSITVMTSGGFQDFFNVKNEKILIVPNKVGEVLSTIPRKCLSFDRKELRFAYVGSIRYESILRFAEVIGEFFSNHRFDFYGSAVDDIKIKIDKIVSRFKNVIYHGVYKNPEDLERIYSDIDIVVACYDVHSENERIAEPNKLYESLFFCKPIIVSEGIYLAGRVKELGCGYAIDASSREKIKLFVNQLKIEDIIEISKVESNIPTDDIIYEPMSLKDAIIRLVDNNGHTI